MSSRRAASSGGDPQVVVLVAGVVAGILTGATAGRWYLDYRGSDSTSAEGSALTVIKYARGNIRR
jgi:hypothetical protein